MRQFGRRQWAGLVLAALLTVLSLSPPYRTVASLPEAIRVPVGAVQHLDVKVPWTVSLRAADSGLLRIGQTDAGYGWSGRVSQQPLALETLGQGDTSLELRLFGWLPLRRLEVSVVPELRVIPGGQSIGVRVESNGVLVVGHASLEGADGSPLEPGRAAGIETGDLIIAVNGQLAGSEEVVARLIDEAGRKGQPATLTIERSGSRRTAAVQPVLDKESGRYRIGLYVRGGAAGVGTLTFYDPASGRFGALGHIISDGDTGAPVAMRRGEIVRAHITSIAKGERSKPGEKVGSLDAKPIGTIASNTPYGIVGDAHAPLHNPLFREPIPVAYAAQIETGPAEILTVLDGEQVERFSIEIERVLTQQRPDGKNMIVHITDPRLLERTGGIVQGMSGSPIVQNGRLIGAVTHVFVNDPTRGYGVFIEWMLREGGILPGDAAWNPAHTAGFLAC